MYVGCSVRPAELTYADVGATQGALPSGYHHLRGSRLIGSGPDAFATAAFALLAWQVQLGAGLRVTASRDGEALPTARCPDTRSAAKRRLRSNSGRTAASYCRLQRSPGRRAWQPAQPVRLGT